MKKKILYASIALIMLGLTALKGLAVTADNALVRQALNEYKRGNYVSCISDLRTYTEQIKNNPLAWYYLGNAYMKIGMKNAAVDAYDKVITLNSMPKLTSYAIQAKLCMDSYAYEKCQYYNLTDEEINALRLNPNTFFANYEANLNKTPEKSLETLELERLIQGQYGNYIHPDAQDFIMQQKTQRRRSEMNH